MSPLRRVAVLLALASFMVVGVGAGPAFAICAATEGGAAPGEVALESRLMAPCCDSPQTLDVHQSPLAIALRAEIHERLCAGESVEAIEDDLVRRHGERILAAPRGGMASVAVPVIGGVVLVASAALLISVLGRWRRRARELGPDELPGGTPSARDAADDRLDDELRRLDGAA
jgi:cytochrome c-type biogenesis protein CcmH